MNIGLLTSIGMTLDAFFPEIIASWEAAGHSIHAASGTPATTIETTVIPGVTRRPAPANLRANRSIHRWVKRSGVDVVISNTATASALARLRPLPVPDVYFCHGLHWNAGKDLPSRTWQGIEWWLLRNTAGVITINTDDHAWFLRRLPPERILRLRGGVGVPLATYPRRPLPAGNIPRLLWIGEFSDRKRPDLMVDIVEELRKREFDVHLTMLGDGDRHAEIRHRIERDGLSAFIELPGRRPAQDALSAAHLVVHTAAWEGLPRVLLEGYATGRRAVAFDVKGVRDIPHAVLVPDGDVQAFADNVVELFQDRDLLYLDDDPGWLDSGRVAGDIATFLEGFVRAKPASPPRVLGGIIRHVHVEGSA